MEIRFARSATKHRISRDRSRFVVENAVVLIRLPPQPGSSSPEQRTLFLGNDSNGNAIEVVALETAEGPILVIHAMKLRKKHREKYEEAMKWNS